jgi:hypothetical protein
MTDTPTPTPAPAPTSAPTPPIYWQGQPWTPDLASARRTELLADSKYCESARNGDSAKQTELSQLYLIERGIAPSPLPESVDDVEIRVLDRAGRDHLVHVETLRQSGFSEQQAREAAGQRPVPLAERQYHERELALLLKDRGAREKILNGDRELGVSFAFIPSARRCQLAASPRFRNGSACTRRPYASD